MFDLCDLLSVASPGYFSVNFTDNRQIELTSTRRAGLMRFTFPEGSDTNYVVVDLVNDLQRSFEGGELIIDTNNSQIMMMGTFLQVCSPAVLLFESPFRHTNHVFPELRAG